MTVHHYLLVDGVMNQQALPKLFARDEPLEVEPLYLGTAWSDVQDLGPILVKAESSSQLFAQMMVDTEWRVSSTKIRSDEDIAALAMHLRNFIAPLDINGGKSLLRFADPLVTQFWLASYSPASLSKLFGPIIDWQILVQQHSWSLNKYSEQSNLYARSEVQQPWLEPYGVLAEEQLSALEQAYDWRFIDRLHLWLLDSRAIDISQIESPHHEHWLKAMLASGREWGLVSERALVTWAEICIAWGDDFAVQPQGHYQHWLDTQPEYKKMAPELRIEALDEYRLCQQVAKDSAHV